jgi:hypothetical protein
VKQEKTDNTKKRKGQPVDSLSQVILGIAGLVIVVLQTIIASMLSDMKKSIDRTWKRINNHYHEVECSNVDCRTLRTGNVILPRGSE